MYFCTIEEGISEEDDIVIPVKRKCMYVCMYVCCNLLASFMNMHAYMCVQLMVISIIVHRAR